MPTKQSGVTQSAGFAKGELTMDSLAAESGMPATLDIIENMV